MKTSFRHCFATVLLVAPVVGFAACANRGMEAPGNPLSDGGSSLTGGHSGGAGGSGGSGTGGHLSGSGGAASGGSGGHGSGGSGASGGGLGTGGAGTGGGTGGAGTGGRTGGAGTGGAGTGGGTGGAGTGGATGGAGTGGTGTGGRGTGGGSGGTGGVSTGGSGGGTGGAGTGGAAGRGGQGGAGGTAGQGGATGQGGSAGSGPVIISIDFVGGRPATVGGADVPDPAMGPTETAGVKPAMNWNSADSVMGTLANLHRSDGSATAATVTWTSPAVGTNLGDWSNVFTDAPGDTRMMNGYLDPTAAASPATVKVSGLPAAIANGYDVYVYCFGDIPQSVTRTYQYAIGTTTVTVSQTGPTTSTTVPGYTLAPSGGSGNYVIFRRVTGASFTLTATPGAGPQTRAPINGVQVVWPSGS